MGVPTQAEYHSLTDNLAARLNADLAGLIALRATAASNPIWAQVQASLDPEVVTGLLSAALAVDAAPLPESYDGLLNVLFNQPAYRSFMSALETQAASGGDYATLRAALTARSAVLNPLVAELWRTMNGTLLADPETSDVATVFAPDYSTRAPTRVYVGADGSLSEETIDSEDAGTADITLFGSDDHCCYLGSDYQFTHAVFGLSTLASVTISPTFQYWNGSAWTTLTVTDNSVGLTKQDTISWAIPSDWERHYKDAGDTVFADRTPRYWIRISRTANTVVTPPVGTSIRIVPAAVTSGSNHLGVAQPPLALCRITAANTIVVEPIADVDFTKFIEPGLYLRALTPFGATITPVASYTNEDGDDVTQAQSGWSSPAALATVAVTLNGSDTGARAVLSTGWTVTASGSGLGVFEVYSSAQTALSRVPAL